MELKQYLQILKRWVWLLILGLVLGGTAGYLYSDMQVPVYQTSTKALVMSAPTGQSTDYTTYYSDLQLVQTYMQLLTTRSFLEGAADRLGYGVSKSQVRVRQDEDTQILNITVEDGDPQHAADIANALVEILIEKNETLQAGRYAATEQNIRAQIASVEAQVASIQASLEQASTQNFQEQLVQVESQIQPIQEEVSVLQQQIAAITPPRNATQKTQIAEMQSRISQIKPLLDTYQQIYSNLVVLGKPVDLGTTDQSSRLAQLQSTLELYQQLYISLLGSLETIHLARMQNTPNIVQIEEAVKPGAPIRPQPINTISLTTAIGLILAAGVAFLVEYLDDTLKTPEDVERVLGLPVLGFVAEMRPRRKSAEEVYIMREPRSPVAEAFRSLRTNMEFAGVEKPISTILITSPAPSEGKTTVAVNLAAVFSQAKKRTVLIDADMRRPRVHQLMGFSNREGLSTLFLNPARISSVGRVREDLPQLLVIPSGEPPPNPAELLGSKRMLQILEGLCRNVNVVIIDGPPSLVADAQILSAKVDAVLMVIRPGTTHREVARASLEMFERAGARVVGVVMNRIPRNRSYYYGGYKSYSPYGDGKVYFSGNGKKPKREEADSPAGKPEQKPAEQPLDRLAETKQEGLVVVIPPAATHAGGLFDKVNVLPPRPDNSGVKR